MMHQTCLDFVANEVYPLLDRLDNHEEGLMADLMKKAGELGLFGVSMPEQYGGYDMDFNTALRVTEGVGGGHSFPVAFAAHTGIAMLPILYFGNEEQKAKYLPKLTSGEWAGAYCLTEPGSGSDALGAKTKAVLTPKAATLRAERPENVDYQRWLCRCVHRFRPGRRRQVHRLHRGAKHARPEPRQRGAQDGYQRLFTRQVFLSDCKVPKENVLGEIGKGHLIAFNILNIGRIKLAAACLGASKMAA